MTRATRATFLFKTLALGSLSLACTAGPPEVLQRAVSPDSLVDALLVRRTGGATVSAEYDVHIVQHGEPPPGFFSRAHFAAVHPLNLHLIWRQPRLLEIRYDQAKINRFVNWWRSRALDNYRYVVELRLVPLSEPWSLSERDRGNW